MTNDNFSRMYTPPDSSLDDYDALIDYALTIDGYRYAEEIWRVQPFTQEHWQKVQSFKQKGRWNGSFEDLRCCLFAYQRSIRWAESGGCDREGRREFMKIYRALCKAWEKRERHTTEKNSDGTRR
ncbi:MAG TPA: hypothetical protein PLZ33_10600 [Smithellaceae bacterium]|nr:hypothetical protein [Smithellaceae bacterium]